MFEIAEELLVNLTLSESQIKAWYLRQSYDMKQIHFDRRALNSQLLIALSYPIQCNNLRDIDYPYKNFYADKERKNFVAMDHNGSGYLFRTELTQQEQMVVERNNQELGYGSTWGYIDSETGFESTLYPTRLSDDGPIVYIAFSKF